MYIEKYVVGIMENKAIIQWYQNMKTMKILNFMYLFVFFFYVNIFNFIFIKIILI